MKPDAIEVEMEIIRMEEEVALRERTRSDREEGSFPTDLSSCQPKQHDVDESVVPILGALAERPSPPLPQENSSVH